MSSLILMLEGLPLLADAAVRALLILGAAAALTLTLRRASAATRHLVWTLALAGVLLVPVMRPVLPRLELPVPTASASVQVIPAPDRAAAIDGSPDIEQFAGSKEPAGRVVEPAPNLLQATSAAAGRSSGRDAADAAALATTDRSVDPVRPLAMLWLLGTLLLLLPIAAGWIGLHRLQRRLPRVDDSRIRHRATRLALRLGLTRSYRILEGAAGSMPMTFGLVRATIVLPADAAAWSRGRLDAVLLHELAHVARRDTATQLLAEVVRAVHWFNPLAWLAARRLRVEREHACDDMALSAGSRPSDYADELLDLIRSYRAAPAPAAALAMARSGEVAGRLRAVLDEGRRRGRVRGVAGLMGVSAGLLVVLACAAAAPVPAEAARPAPAEAARHAPADDPASAIDVDAGIGGLAGTSPSAPTTGPLQAVSCVATAGDWNQLQHQSNNGRITIRMERRGCEFELRMEGDVEFDAYAMTVRRMGSNARLRVEEDSPGTDHSLDVRVGRNGAPVYGYERNGTGRVFDAEAEAWFASALEALFRNTGFMAEARVEALLRAGGVEAVLGELGELHSSHAVGSYTEALLEQARLNEAQLRAVIRTSTRRVESDHYLAGILEAVAAHQPLMGGLLDDYLVATASLESDHYRSEALGAAIQSDRLTGPQVERVLQTAGTMDSDHYRSDILTAIADRYALEPAFRAAYLEATASMDSDHYRSEVLGRLLDRSDLTADDRANVLRATSMIGSDHYRSELLRKIAAHGLPEPALQHAFFEVAAGLDSDHYYRESLQALLRQGVDAPLLVRVIDSAARDLDSDHYLSELLLSILADYPVTGDVRASFARATDGIDSQHYRARVADALLRAERR